MAVEDLHEPELQEQNNGDDEWRNWFPDAGDQNNVDDHPLPPQHPVQPQDTVSFDQSGSTAQYLRANSPDTVLTMEDLLAGNLGSSASVSSNSSDAEVLCSFPDCGGKGLQHDEARED